MPYHADAVHFDGDLNDGQRLTIASLTSTDNFFFSWSMWFKYATADASLLDPIWHADADGNGGPVSEWVLDTGVHKIRVLLLGGDGGDTFRGTTQIQPAADVWHHMLWAADTNATAGNKIMKLYLDDVDTTLTKNDADAAFTILTNGLTFDFNNNSGAGTQWDVADFWFGIGQNLLVAGDIPEATRRAFIDASGKPVYLGANGELPTGTAPRIFWSGQAATFATNLGTGGAFTLANGPLTDSADSPSGPVVPDEDAAAVGGGGGWQLFNYDYQPPAKKRKKKVDDIFDDIEAALKDSER